MPRCVIVLGGDFGAMSFDPRPDDFVIACDKGIEYTAPPSHTDANLLTPTFPFSADLAVGDFDSTDVTPTCPILRYPIEKDDTDCMIAVKEGLARGYTEFCLLCAFGGRFDHMYAHITVLEYLSEQGAVGTLYGSNEQVTVTESSVQIPRRDGYSLSIFALGGSSEGVTITGAKYTLENATLHPQFALGVSNSATAEYATVGVKKGRLLIIQSKL